jgi:hypothetical protein
MWLAVALLTAAPASAAITIDFEGVRNYERPGNYYAGGTSIYAGNGQPGASIGPDLGVVFTDAAFVWQRYDMCTDGGCGGVFPGGTSGSRAMYNFGQYSNSPALTTVNIAAGFVGSASVYHYGGVSSMQIYRDVGGQAGNGGFAELLGVIAMPQTDGCVVDGNLTVTGCSFTKYTINFTGTARSIVLAGSASYFDDLTIGATGVPEPASWAMLIAGFGLTGAAMRRRRTVSI